MVPLIIIAVVLRRRTGCLMPMLMLLPRIALLFFAVRGLEVAVESKNNSVLVSFK